VEVGVKTLAYRLTAVALIGVALSFTTDSFLTVANVLNVFRQASLTILTAGLDLSVGANVGLSACLAATVMQSSGSVALGAATGLVFGAGVGVVNGLMVTLLRLPPFIATYGMLWTLNGFTYWFMGGDTIHGFSPGFRALGSGYWLGVPIPIYLMLGFLLAGAVFTRYTTLGHDVYAIGANREAARLSGVPVRSRINLVYVLSGAMAGLAAVVYLARLNSAEADIGEPLTLPAIAAVLIGGTSLFGGVGSLLGTLVGALTLTLVVNGMNLLAVDASWQPLVTGVIVLLAVWIDVVTRQRAEANA
jgi:ribose transport system permease protein